MKKILLLTVALLSTILLPAQGVYQLWGTTIHGGINDQGVIFRYNPASNIYTRKFDFGNLLGQYPSSSFTLYNSKLYGTAGLGGSNGMGVIFEWDLLSNKYTKKYDVSSMDGHHSYGNLILKDGKFYGTAYDGYFDGTKNISGVIFEWDPETNIYTKKIGFDNIMMGSNPSGALILYNNKFYGITSRGGNNNDGVIFEWDPATNIYTKKIDLASPNGNCTGGSLTLLGNKFYGVTMGTIFEWDPLTNIFVTKIIFDKDGQLGCGTMAFFGGKFYGMTVAGGLYDGGVIFEWDPVTNNYNKKNDFDGPNGFQPWGSLTLYNSKFYGMTYNGGVYNKGVLFEWDPSTNIFNKRRDFNGLDGEFPHIGNNLVKTPAPVSNGLPGSCITFLTITINNSNNNQWVPITDEDGNAVAEIKANGNNLGTVTTAVFINNAAVREDASKKLYLDRSITITPQVQPTTSVDVRLYIKGIEYEALKNAVNSNGQLAGIDSVGDIAVYKVSGGCSPAVSSLSNKITATAGAWEADYVFSASITSFSSFYFAGKAALCSAPVITQVHANPDKLWPPNHQLKNVTVNYNITGTCTPITSWLTVSSNEPLTGTGCGDIAPDWIIVNNHHLKLRAERSGHGNGRIYSICINTKDAAGNIATKKINVTVPHNQGCSNSKGIYSNEGYIDANGDYFDQWFDCSVTPNPSSGSFNLQVATASNEKIEVIISDISGRVIKKLSTQKDQQLHFGNELQPGLYLVKVMQGSQQQIIKLVKQ